MLRQPSLWFCQAAGGCVGSPAHALPSASSSSTQLSMSFGSCTTSAIWNVPHAVSPAPENALTGGRFVFADPSALHSQRFPTENEKFSSGGIPVSFAIPSIGGIAGVGVAVNVDVAVAVLLGVGVAVASAQVIVASVVPVGIVFAS